MYTATMDYIFTPEGFDRACELWKTRVLDQATGQPGFVRMQFLTAPPRAMAVGTWKTKAHAESFMRQGVFVSLMDELTALCAGPPVPRTWQLRFFAGS